jgi:hypothetical protein
MRLDYLKQKNPSPRGAAEGGVSKGEGRQHDSESHQAAGRIFAFSG